MTQCDHAFVALWSRQGEGVEQDTRRLALRLSAKFMITIAAIGVVYVFMANFLSSNREEVVTPTLRVTLAGIEPGQTRRLTWEGSPVLIHRRTADEVAALEASADASPQESGPILADPMSRKSRQPDWAATTFRSRTPEWFVAIAAGTDFSCPLEYVAAGEDTFQGAPWPGGYADECRGSRYDSAGRVYEDQYADRNLIIPPYDLDGDDVVFGR